MSSVEVQIELGHEAYPRATPTEQGYTHDWTVYVRGVNGCNIEHFVEKVVFNLHGSFPKPRRVISKPPYKVSESGYAGFILIIEILFKNKEEPKKAKFNYDLFLTVNGAAESSQIEKLTFQNPSSEFKKKLLKSGGHCYDKPIVPVTKDHSDQRHPPLPSSGKSSKSSLSKDVKEKKLSKLTSVAPSKDKPPHSQLLPQSSHHGPTSSSIALPSQLSSNATQTTSSSSSSSSLVASAHHSTHSHLDKLTNSSSLSQPLQDQFTDLFGIPIQARPSPDSLHSKAKDKVSISSQKSSSKKISPTDNTKSTFSSNKSVEKEKKHKSSSGSVTTENKIDKSGKSSRKHEENVKPRKNKDKDKDRDKDKSAKITSGDLFSTVTSNPSTIYAEKKSSPKESGTGSGNKKRKHSDSSSSLDNDTEDKDRKFSSFSKSSLSTKESSDKSHKEKSKKQRTSSKDVISSSATTGSNSNQKVKDIKKESSTSTTISLTNNNNTGTTTLEIKSIKKEKTWDSEVKKSRNKEYKTNKEQTGKLDEIKSSRENINKEIKVRDRDRDEKERDIDRIKEKNKTKGFLGSPKDSFARYLKVPKDKMHAPSSLRDPSVSPASNISGSYTPGGANYMGAPSSASSINNNISGLIAEMGNESLPVSPLSSCDPPSPLTFGSDPTKAKDDSSDGEKESSTEKTMRKGDNSNNSQKKSDRKPVDIYKDSLVNYNNKRNLLTSEMSDGNDYKQHILSPSKHENQGGPNYYDIEYINQLKVLYRKINELRDRDTLQKIVDIIEETGLFTITSTAIDFDLMQLDKSTVKKIKLCLSKS